MAQNPQFQVDNDQFQISGRMVRMPKS